MARGSPGRGGVSRHACLWYMVRPMLVQLADIQFGYAGEDLLDGLTWQINPGDHIGLVGPNGAGKSTLLRLLAGELEPEAGQVARARGVRVGYLHQSQEFRGEGTIRGALLAPFAEVVAMGEELAALSLQLEADPAPETVARYGHLEEIYRQRGGYALEARLRELVADVGFSEADMARSIATLSGGERNRLELAKVILAAPDLLLLDEPTNHLDMQSCEKLEEVLATYPGAFVLVSHDRRLLDAVCREIVEVDDGSLEHYAGGWSIYVEERDKRRAQALALFQRQQEEIARTEDFIRKNLAGQKSTQAKSRRKMLEKIERLEWHRDVWADAGRIGLRFDIGDRVGGKEALVAEGLIFGYPGAPLGSGLDLTVYRGERLGIVGPNGCGKSTLLQTLLGRMAPLAGTCRQGYDLRLGYFDQKLAGLDEERSLIEEIRSIRGDLSPDGVRNILGRFRFFGDDAFRVVKGLSGGERNRLALAKLMLRPANLLALDEPTNHLDIPAREVLERALRAYEGTLLVVSHDRYFLDQVCTRLVVFEGGALHQEVGNYSDWRHRRAARAAAEPAAAPRPVVRGAGAEAYERDKAKKAERARLERRFAAVEAEIGEIEDQLAALRGRLASEHGGDWQKLHALVEEERGLARRLEERLGEWERLGEQVAQA
jgi:ATP-binding cassette, subfamily F, member 3